MDMRVAGSGVIVDHSSSQNVLNDYIRFRVRMINGDRSIAMSFSIILEVRRRMEA